jgi:hypothetical protein
VEVGVEMQDACGSPFELVPRLFADSFPHTFHPTHDAAPQSHLGRTKKVSHPDPSDGRVAEHILRFVRIEVKWHPALHQFILPDRIGQHETNTAHDRSTATAPSQDHHPPACGADISETCSLLTAANIHSSRIHQAGIVTGP